MKFQIENTDGTKWVYDNLTNRVESLTGAPSNIEAMKRCFVRDHKPVVADPTRCDAIKPKGKTLGKLRILVGTNCNYKCSFCVQVDGDYHSKLVKPEQIDHFFDEMDAAGVTLAEKGKVELWGGEPLVYWKSIRHLIPRLRERYPDADLSMISNGTLINDEILAFLIKHKVSLTFSHDAQAYFLRGPDPLDDPAKRAMWRRVFRSYREAGLRFGINCVISQYNCDLQAVAKFFAEKIDPDVQFGFEGVVIAHSPSAIKVCVFPKKARETLAASIRKAVLEEEDTNLHHVLSRYVVRLLTAMGNQEPSAAYRARCDVLNPDSLVVDLYGRVLRCHNVSPKDWIIGDINHLEDVDLSRYTPWDKRPRCPECHVLALCSGNCPITSPAEHQAGCQTQRMFNNVFFEIVWLLLTGAEVKSITKLSEKLYNN